MYHVITELNFMVKNNLLCFFLCILLFTSCTSRLVVKTKGCNTKATWSSVDREYDSSLGDKFASNVKRQEKYFDYVLIERIWTPLGQISREKLLLEDLLRLNGLNCSNIKTVEISYFNDYVDIISSVIPFLSSRSIMIKVVKR